MSIRSIIEINHDYLQQLVDRGYVNDEFARFLMESGKVWLINGVEIREQFHHSVNYKIVPK